MILLPWPHRNLSPNARTHWAAKARSVSKAKSDAFYATKASGYLRPFTRFSLTFCPPDNRRRDLDNLIASMKPALDGMAKAWGVDDAAFRWSADIGEAVPGGRVIVTPDDVQEVPFRGVIS